MIWMERQIEGLRPPPIRTPTELFRVARRPRLICVVSNGAHFVRTTPPLQPLMVPRRGLIPQVLRGTAAQRSSGGFTRLVSPRGPAALPRPDPLGRAYWVVENGGVGSRFAR